MNMHQASPLKKSALHNVRSLKSSYRSAQQSKDWGLANEVFDEASGLDAALDDACRRIVGNSADAVAAVKDLYRQSEREVGIKESLKIEGANQPQNPKTPLV